MLLQEETVPVSEHIFLAHWKPRKPRLPQKLHGETLTWQRPGKTSRHCDVCVMLLDAV